MFSTHTGKSMTDLAELTAIDLLTHYRSGTASPVDATAAALSALQGMTRR